MGEGKKASATFPTYRSNRHGRVQLFSAPQSILLDPGRVLLRQQSAIGEESFQAAVSAGGPGRELQRRGGLARRGFAANDVEQRLLEEREVRAVARAAWPTAAFQWARLAARAEEVRRDGSGALAASVSRPQEQRETGLARLAFVGGKIVVVFGGETQQDAQVRVSAAARHRHTQVLSARGRRRWDAGVAQATLLGGRGHLEEREGGVVAELDSELRLVLGYSGGGTGGPRGREEGDELSVLIQPAGVDGGGAPSPRVQSRADAELCAQRRPP